MVGQLRLANAIPFSTDHTTKAPKDDVAANPPCHPRACAIQDCLTKNNYNEAKCQNAIRALYDCCAAFYDRHGDDASSVSCPKPKLLRLKLKQLDEAK